MIYHKLLLYLYASFLPNCLKLLSKELKTSIEAQIKIKQNSKTFKPCNGLGLPYNQEGTQKPTKGIINLSSIWIKGGVITRC